MLIYLISIYGLPKLSQFLKLLLSLLQSWRLVFVLELFFDLFVLRFGLFDLFETSPWLLFKFLSLLTSSFDFLFNAFFLFLLQFFLPFELLLSALFILHSLKLQLSSFFFLFLQLELLAILFLVLDLSDQWSRLSLIRELILLLLTENIVCVSHFANLLFYDSKLGFELSHCSSLVIRSAPLLH